ncbi:hypothetical protein AB6G21_14980 [Providencia hangzhouensis]
MKIMNSSGTQIKVNSGAKQNYVEGNNTLKFQASLIGLQLVDAAKQSYSSNTREIPSSY